MEHKLTFELCIKGKDQIQDVKSTNVVVLIMLNKNLNFHSFTFCICFHTFKKYISCLYLVDYL
jgi:hypothetical protein